MGIVSLVRLALFVEETWPAPIHRYISPRRNVSIKRKYERFDERKLRFYFSRQFAGSFRESPICAWIVATINDSRSIYSHCRQIAARFAHRRQLAECSVSNCLVRMEGSLCRTLVVSRMQLTNQRTKVETSIYRRNYRDNIAFNRRFFCSSLQLHAGPDCAYNREVWFFGLIDRCRYLVSVIIFTTTES